MILKGKKILITGMLNRRSIAYAIAKACQAEGAELAFTCQGENLLERVRSVAAEFGQPPLYLCDVASDAQIDAAITALAAQWGTIDGIVHAVAFAPPASLAGDFLEHAEREAFHIAQDITAYSLIALAKAARPHLAPAASLLTLSFMGAERAVPNYNLMGVAKAALESSVRYLAASMGPGGHRVNAISAGPARTASALAFPVLIEAMNFCERQAPLRRNVELDEIASVATFLLSNRASAVTGEVLHVDCGFHAVSPGLFGMQQTISA